VPLLVLRARTERPEAIACGGVELVGTEPNRIVSAVRRHLKSPRSNSTSAPFGDGRAGERMAAIIEMWLAGRGLLSSKSSSVSQTAG
jgi:UDP-N-acetylglucosamine 2-epimerase (non-hydrolysing)